MNAPARRAAGSAPRLSIRNYAIVTAAYWAFTLTDGALRMLVLLHFDRLGYSAVQIAFLFLFYEFFGRTRRTPSQGRVTANLEELR